MVIVNIILVTGMVMFVVEVFSYLIPALIKEFKETEDKKRDNTWILTLKVRLFKYPTNYNTKK